MLKGSPVKAQGYTPDKIDAVDDRPEAIALIYGALEVSRDPQCLQPALAKELNPALSDAELLPASTSQGRLDLAVLRMLGTKAALSLHRQKEADSFQKPLAEVKALIENSTAKTIAEDIAGRAVTLVKDGGGLLPITPERHSMEHIGLGHMMDFTWQMSRVR